jgi:general secretion pathway protein G
MKRKLMSNKQSGFTLIEVMVVVVILGILAAVVVPNIMDEPEKARINKAKQDIRALEEALNRYKLDNYDYPSTEQGLKALVEKPTGSPEPKRWKGPYVKKINQDPWQNEYEYLNPGTHGKIDVFSVGKDVGSPDDDIGNWNLDEDIAIK